MRSDSPGNEEEVAVPTNPVSDEGEGEDGFATPVENLPSPSQPRKHLPLPKIVIDSGLWVWIWVIGAIVLLVLLFLLVSTIPAKKGTVPVMYSTHRDPAMHLLTDDLAAGSRHKGALVSSLAR